MSGPTSEELARFVSALRYDALPADIVQCTKRILLDDLGSIIGGFSEPEVRALAIAWPPVVAGKRRPSWELASLASIRPGPR